VALAVGTNPLETPIDPSGNLASKTEGTDTWTYTWSAENQLVKVAKNGVEQARFSYDPLERRAEKVAGGLTTSYTYDGVHAAWGTGTEHAAHRPATVAAAHRT
jgi:YD repeat-containing protein